MKTIRYFSMMRLLLAVAAIAFINTACTDDFTDLNTNPHQATEDKLLYDNLATGTFFVQMQSNVFPIAQQPAFGDEVYQTMQNLAGDIYSGYMGVSNNWFSNANNSTYALIPQWYRQAFSRAFVGVMPAWDAIKHFAEEETPQVYAMATVVKVLALQRTTDMYGPLPYLNFGSGGLQNQYDSQEDIYMAFFDELNEAIDILTDFADSNPGVPVMEQYDFVYGGNVSNWVKFANTLKLRMAIRIVYANPEKAQMEAESAVNHHIGVITGVNEVAALNQSSTLNFNHPLFIICYNFDDIRMGANMESFLTGYNDPRAPSMFVPNSEGEYKGIRTGININNRAQYADGPFSLLEVSPSASIVWINPAESYFLRSEGALRGWNMGGSAQDLYEEGIRTSFSFHGAGGADTYIQDNTSIPAAYVDPVNGGNNVSAGSSLLSQITVQWDDADDFETKLERLITQKWIAMYPDGQEAWSEFRRTGYPKVFPVVHNNSGGTINTATQIRRLPFPDIEYQNNAAEVSRAVNLLGGSDNGGTKLWWDKK